MPSTRTQVYLTPEQRARIDELRARDGRTLAQVVRDALDAYLTDPGGGVDEVLASTAGSMPDLKVPSRDEWDRGYG